MRVPALAFSTLGLLFVLNPPARAGVCGDGTIDLLEECDDGNLVDGDGCASTCTVEQQCYDVGNTFSFFSWSDSTTSAGEYGVLRVFKDTVNRTRYPDRVIPRLWISTGDIPYMVMSEDKLDSLNNTISNSASGQKYPFTCSASSGKFPYFVALGNHDLDGWSATWTADQQMAYWRDYVGPRFPTALLGAQNFVWGPDNVYDARTNYSFDYKSAHFVVLNEYYGDSAFPTNTPLGCIRPELLAWLEEDLEATTRPVKFVFGHEPARSYCSNLDDYGGEFCPLTHRDNQDPPKRPRPYSTTGSWKEPFGKHWGDSLEDERCPAGSRKTFWAALVAHGVTAFFSGHTHTYSGRLVRGNGRNDVPAYSKTGQVFDSAEGVWEINTGQVHTTGGSLYVLTTVRDNLVTFETFDQIGGGTTPEPYSLVESWSVRLPNSPAVSLTQPAAGATFTAPADIHLVAEASDPDGTVVEVSFLAGTTVIGATSSAPHEVTWRDVPAGSYSLTAVARDDGGAATSSVPVAITVHAVNPNQVPTAQGQAVTVAEDEVVGITLRGTDPEGKALTYATVSAPAHGRLKGCGASWSYTPAPNYAGADSFSFRVTDAAGQASEPAVVSITVTAVNDVPVAAFILTPARGPAPLAVGADAGGSSDVEGALEGYEWSFGDGGTGSGVTASHNYTRAGSYVVMLTVSDAQGATATATEAVTVSPNGVPTAQGQAVMVPEDGVVGITLTGADPEGGELTYAIVSAPGHGTLNGSGASWTYTPALNYVGPDSFSFRVRDPVGQSSEPAVVSITVTGVNDVPVAAFTLTPATGTAPLVMGVDAGGSSDVKGPLTYEWSFGDGITGSGVTTSHTYTQAGTYVVTLTVRGTDQATATAAQAVTVTAATAGSWDAAWTQRKQRVFDA